jgi:hypothetical protein
MSHATRIRKYALERNECGASVGASKRRKLSTQGPNTKVCSLCHSIRFCDIPSLPWETLQSTGTDGYLLGTRSLDKKLSDSIVASCITCQLLKFMLDRPVAAYEALQLRAYSAFGNARGSSFKRLPKELKSRDVPHLAVIGLNTSSRSISEIGTRRAICLGSANKHNPVFTPQIISSKVDYNVIRTWLECCQTLHRSLCTKTQAKTRPLRFIDCTSLPPSLVAAPQNSPYLALSYTWGSQNSRCSAVSTAPAEFRRSIMSPIILCPPKTVSDAIIVTKELGFRYLWVDAYCIDQGSKQEKASQIHIMDEIYGSAELTIVAAAGSHNNHGLPGASTIRRNNLQQALEPIIDLGQVRLIPVERCPQSSIMSSTWATRAWTYQEAILSQRLLYFTDCEVYFECHSMQIRESMHAEWKSLHCKQGKFYDQLNNGLFLGRISCPNSYLRAPPKFLMRSYELLRKYTGRAMSHDNDSLRAAAGVLNYLQNGKVPVYQISGIPFIFEPGSLEAAHKSFMASLLWIHKRTFPATHGCTLPLPTRRYFLPSWSWAGWKGEIDFVVNPTWERDMRYAMFKPLAKVTHFSLKVDVSIEADKVFNNPVQMTPKGAIAFTIQARFLCSDSFSISFTQSKPMCRITSKLNPPGMHPTWDPSRPAQPSRRGKRQPPPFHPGSKGRLYICKGPQTYTNLSRFFDDNRLETILMGTSPKVDRQLQRGALFFLIVEPKGSVYSRVGLLEIKEDLDAFSTDLQFEERSITII